MHITLEDLLSSWRAALALGGGEDREMAIVVARSILRQAGFSHDNPDALDIGDRSVASAADRLRLKAQKTGYPEASFSNSTDLRVLSVVSSVFASELARRNQPTN